MFQQIIGIRMGWNSYHLLVDRLIYLWEKEFVQNAIGHPTRLYDKRDGLNFARINFPHCDIKMFWHDALHWLYWWSPRYILIRTCVLTNKLQTSFVCEFLYSYRRVVHTNIQMLVFFLHIFSPEKILNTIDQNVDLLTLTFLICRLPVTWHRLISYLFWDFVSILLVELLNTKCHQIGKDQ